MKNDSINNGTLTGKTMVIHANSSKELKVTDIILPGHNEFILDSLPISDVNDIYIINCASNHRHNSQPTQAPVNGAQLKLQAINVLVKLPVPTITTTYTTTQTIQSSSIPSEPQATSSDFYLCKYRQEVLLC